MSRPNRYLPPPWSLLDAPAARPDVSERDLLDSARAVEQRCRARSLAGRVTMIHPGPVVTGFDYALEVPLGCGNLPTIAREIRLALDDESLRVERASRKSAVRIEIPNRVAQETSMAELLSSDKYALGREELPLALGVTATGDPFIRDLAQLPHLLVAGPPGSRVEPFARALVAGLVCRIAPEEMGLILVDSSGGGLSAFLGIPHLLAGAIVQPTAGLDVLRWAVGELEARFAGFESVSVRDIARYNRVIARRSRRASPASGRFRRLVLVIGELAELVQASCAEVEIWLTLFEHTSRAVGIHIIAATTHPAPDVLTPLIKASLPVRSAFRMPSMAESRAVLDADDAVRLRGGCDMLHLTAAGRVVRLHPPEVTVREAARIASHLRAHGRPRPDAADALSFARAVSTAGPGRKRDHRDR
jgi:DNA segregation ATPase FtsK/SpoIIIE, S-DNA-T family